MTDKVPIPSHRRAVLAYAPAVFLGAFLLFQVQPLIGKYILPWFGGSPEVWTVCMLLFQTLLLAGYAYAHLSVTRLSGRMQAAVHAALLVAAIALLPITPSDAWKPQAGDNPTLGILIILAANVGVPFFVLSATGPLLQSWFARTSGGASPYRLYALSNAGSLLALVSYPFLVEPVLSRQSQATVWSVGLAVFAVICGLCAIKLWRHQSFVQSLAKPDKRDQADPPASSRASRLLWLALPAVASLELLAVTTKISQDVAAVPFLWVLPLGLYLLSFIICFHHEKWYVRPLFLTAFILSIIGVALAKAYAHDLSAAQQISIYCAALFACCMVCHGELFRLRPHPKHLTSYYLSIAAGGVIGGFLVAVVAPLVFDGYRELHLGLLAGCLCALLADTSDALKRGGRKWIYVGLLLAVGMVAIFAQDRRGGANETALMSRRNFFGVLTLWEKDPGDPLMHRYLMQHGTTFHGLQFTNATMRLLPTAYYGQTSGVGLAMRFFRPDRPRRIGVVGLGVGTIAAYGKAGDVIRFYEINPEVTHWARTRFSYLSSCKATLDVVMGDARLSMERQSPQNFDLLVLDAFASDAVPVHLLTAEAFEVYLRHLAYGGVIAVHISTVHLDLQAVVWRLARHFGLSAAWIEDRQSAERGTFASDWLLLTRNREFIDLPRIRLNASQPPEHWDSVDLWTDDRVNLLQILR